MIKAFKWIYDLGYKAGWDAACNAVNVKGYSIVPSSEEIAEPSETHQLNKKGME